jgi:hypothetical protein
MVKGPLFLSARCHLLRQRAVLIRRSNCESDSDGNETRVAREFIFTYKGVNYTFLV